MARNSKQKADDPPGTAGLLQTFGATLLALIVGATCILQATDGGRALTTETLRRSEVARRPQSVPDLALRDGAGHETRLQKLLASGGKVWIVDFIYTRCETVCSALGATFQRLQRELLDRGLEQRVGLLSISFDPANDDKAALRAYAARMNTDPSAWQVVTLASAADRKALLDAFGIMVIPAELGEFEHNAAFHIVDDRATLVRIVDYSSIGGALHSALPWNP